jgi:hypothetical protein
VALLVGPQGRRVFGLDREKSRVTRFVYVDLAGTRIDRGSDDRGSDFRSQVPGSWRPRSVSP